MGKLNKHKISRPYAKLGSFLKEARKASGHTQREVSEALGYSSPQFISNAECGISAIPLPKMVVLKKLYGLESLALADRILSDEKAILLEAFEKGVQRNKIHKNK